LKVAAPKRSVRELLLGRDLINRWVALIKAVGLYEKENDALRATSENLRLTIGDYLDDDVELEFTQRQGGIYIGGQFIRESAVASSNYHRFIDVLRTAGIGSFRVDAEVRASELEIFARLIFEAIDGRRRGEGLVNELSVRGQGNIDVSPAEEENLPAAEVDSEHVAKRIYLRSICLVKGVFHELRRHDRISARRVKRVVQEMIEFLELEPQYLLNLTSLKNYDEYTFNHSVNVSVLAVALGRHIGLPRRQLYAVGQAGLLHDLGKLCIPRELLNKPGRLTPEERRVIQAHPAEGFISIASQLGISSDTISVALAAYEHHLNADGTGYPAAATSRRRGLLSRIVAIVDRYDAMTSARVYRGEPIRPPKALAILYNSQRAQHDQVLLKYFMNLMGYYPLGSVVRLSDGSLGIVVGAAEDPQLRHLPTVKRVLDAEGRPTGNETLHLAKPTGAGDPLKVEEVVDPAAYGIEIMDYIL
jgi:HD-GYP domain-containing protein (c-di-GMP phosphodiesterase class II)